MRGVEGARDGREQRERALRLERRARREELPQVRALDEPHRDEEPFVVLAGLVDRHHVRVIEARGEPRLAQEALAEPVVVGELRASSFSATGGPSRRVHEPRTPRPCRPCRPAPRSDRRRATPRQLSCACEAMADSLVAATEGKGGSADCRGRTWRLAGPSLAVHARAGVHSCPRATADQAAAAAQPENTAVRSRRRPAPAKTTESPSRRGDRSRRSPELPERLLRAWMRARPGQAPQGRLGRPAEVPLGRSRCIRCIGTPCARDWRKLARRRCRDEAEATLRAPTYLGSARCAGKQCSFQAKAKARGLGLQAFGA